MCVALPVALLVLFEVSSVPELKLQSSIDVLLALVAEKAAIIISCGIGMLLQQAIVADSPQNIAVVPLDRGAAIADRGAAVADRGTAVADRGATVADRGTAVVVRSHSAYNNFKDTNIPAKVFFILHLSSKMRFAHVFVRKTLDGKGKSTTPIHEKAKSKSPKQSDPLARSWLVGLSIVFLFAVRVEFYSF